MIKLLDDAYANAAYIPNGNQFPPRWAQAAQAFRDGWTGGVHLGVTYGDGARQRFDLFEPKARAQGVLIFVHGGFWRAFDGSSWSHLARGALAHGYCVAMPSYDLCPDVSIAQITRQIAMAVQAISRRCDGQVVLTGHSAGGHLVARMLAPGLLPHNVQRRIVRVAPISPLSDLLPLIQTQMNDDFRLTPGDARAESPIHQPAPVDADVSIWVGEAERPAFVDQARWLSQAWNVPLHLAPKRHHFDIIEPLEDPQSDLIGWLVGN